jgi:hypothetical protein
MDDPEFFAAHPLLYQEDRPTMPIHPGHVTQQGGGQKAVIVRCPNVVGDRLVHFSRNDLDQTWVIRDFITRKQLTNIASPLTAVAIEADANHSEVAPFHDVARVDEWAGYLLLKTMVVFHPQSPTQRTPPNPASGAWLSL